MSESARRRILVVDDEQDVIDILQEHLATTYDVTPARDGKRALELVRATRVTSRSTAGGFGCRRPAP